MKHLQASREKREEGHFNSLNGKERSLLGRDLYVLFTERFSIWKNQSHERSWPGLWFSSDAARMFAGQRWNYKVYADLGLNYTRAQHMAAVLRSGTGPNFIRQTELPDGFRTLMSAGPLPNISHDSINPF